MAKNKLSRKKLLKEPDEFMTFTGSLIKFATAHRVRLSYGLAALIAIALAITGMRYFSDRAEAKAFALLEKSKAGYETTLKEAGVDGAFKAAQTSYKEILDNYSSTQAGRLARVMYADICFTAGDYEQAIELYRRALQDFGESEMIINLIRSSLGYAYEGNQDPKAAVAHFEMIVSSPTAVAKDEALFNLGRLYEQMGEQEKSVQAYKQLTTEFTDSVYLELAREKTVG